MAGYPGQNWGGQPQQYGGQQYGAQPGEIIFKDII